MEFERAATMAWKRMMEKIDAEQPTVWKRFDEERSELGILLSETAILQLPGGFLYRTIVYAENGQDIATAMVFVPHG